MEKVAVHVELLTPSRLPSMGSDYPVLGLCDSDDGRFPSFGTPAHRDALLADFEALVEPAWALSNNRRRGHERLISRR